MHQADTSHFEVLILVTEVEQVIESVIDEVIATSDGLKLLRPEILDALVQALEKDASWVPLYEVTGELIIPEVAAEEGDLGEALTKVKEVCHIKDRLYVVKLTDFFSH